MEIQEVDHKLNQVIYEMLSFRPISISPAWQKWAQSRINNYPLNNLELQSAIEIAEQRGGVFYGKLLILLNAAKSHIFFADDWITNAKIGGTGDGYYSKEEYLHNALKQIDRAYGCLEGSRRQWSILSKYL